MLRSPRIFSKIRLANIRKSDIYILKRFSFIYIYIIQTNLLDWFGNQMRPRSSLLQLRI